MVARGTRTARLHQARGQFLAAAGLAGDIDGAWLRASLIDLPAHLFA